MGCKESNQTNEFRDPYIWNSVGEHYSISINEYFEAKHVHEPLAKKTMEVIIQTSCEGCILSYPNGFFCIPSKGNFYLTCTIYTERSLIELDLNINKLKVVILK